MSSRQARATLLARIAVLAAVAALVVLVATPAGGLVVLATGVVGLALAAVGVWWAVAHRRALRMLGLVLAVAAPLCVFALYTAHGLWLDAFGGLVLWGAALLCARGVMREVRPAHGMRTRESPPPAHPVLIMNPKSGGGKVGRFDLVRKAEALGARVVLLDTAQHQDVAALARRAVADGADLLGVAGGDGTQALVADVAAERGVPFMVVSAGTRNHFAMDLLLDRDDPSTCLDALTDGVELTVDLGRVADRPFVNTVSFGVYAQIVQSPEYRDAKASTALGALPDLLLGSTGPRLAAVAGGTRLDNPQALLVSNNPYAGADPLGAGRRPRLDGGALGVLGLRVDGAAQAADLALRGARSPAVSLLTAGRVTVTADAATVPVGVDGEAVVLPTPVVCEIRPGALRVRVPRHRPGAPPPAAPADWRLILRLALGRRTGIQAGV
ncbi:diacylglycerol/lipid kinase family protein [Kitasatospora sp. NPDC051705]|uniref:diacylglycerol/lipid kinase family protein n=1 Tax=Kitasatospora sp. NPDC051705 TaxID=3364057 RepID=UPI003794C9A6